MTITNEEKIKLITTHMESILDIMDFPVNESTQGTPKRVAKMWVNELFRNVNDKTIEDLNSRMTLFENEGSDQMVIMRGIKFNSTCEHHLLPFNGEVTVGYVPSEKIIGLSKIPRVVKYFSQKPQLQERLTEEIAQYLKEVLEPRALFVEVKATHQCVMCRGAESDCETLTMYRHTEKGFESAEEEFYKRTGR